MSNATRRGSHTISVGSGCLALAFLTSCEGIQALLAATGDAESLVRLGTCSRSLRHSVFSCCVDWMELGLGQAVGRLGENHIFFGASA